MTDNENTTRKSSSGIGGLRKIADATPPCTHPEHNPPSHMVYSPGVYEYTCPACGQVVIFTVHN